jgi:glutaredoxin 3
VKEFLSLKGIPYVDRDVTRDPVAASEMYQRSGQSGVPVIVVDGQVVIGFDRARLESLLAGYGPGKPSLGALVADAADILAQKGLMPTDGAYVGRVKPGTPADRAGLREGDIIVMLNGHPVRRAADVSRLLAQASPGSRITLRAFRQGAVTQFEAVV